MSLAHPWILLLALPWLLALFGASAHQGRAMAWVDENVAARFRSMLTGHDADSWPRHLILIAVMGLLLIVAGSGPRWIGGGSETIEAADILLVMDASASMNATDVGPMQATGEEYKNRFSAAKAFAEALVQAMPHHRFGLISFSGVATLQMPLTDDTSALLDGLQMLEVHNFYQSTGSNLRKVLEAVVPYAVDHEDSLQVILLGDGEIPEQRLAKSGDVDSVLRIFEDRGVPIHGITFGSLTGEDRLIYYFPDVVAKKEDKKVLAEFKTRRVDRHFASIAHRTGGWSGYGGDVEIPTLKEVIRRGQRKSKTIDVDGSKDLAWYFVVAFAVLFVFERFYPSPRRPTPPPFRFDALGEPEARPGGRAGLGSARLKASVAAIALMGLAACGGVGLLELAHQANEQGIALDAAFLHGQAQPRYEESRGFGVREQIPTFNQARSAGLAGRFAEAHDLYQRALEIDPEMAPALYNDGHNFYQWGEAERDPRDCDLDRTLDLWSSARDRFIEVSDLTGDRSLREDADKNFGFVVRQIAELEKLIEDPPPHCSGGGGSPDASSGGGGAGGGQTPPPSGQDPQDPPQDPSGDQESPPDGEGQDPPPDGEGQDPPPQGGQEPPPGSPPPGSSQQTGAGAQAPLQQPLNAEEQAQVQAALSRIAEQTRSDGRYFRRSQEEQFSKESWQQPEAEIWW